VNHVYQLDGGAWICSGHSLFGQLFGFSAFQFFQKSLSNDDPLHPVSRAGGCEGAEKTE